MILLELSRIWMVNWFHKENGGYWDHMQEMQNTLRGQKSCGYTLKNVNNPEAQAAYGRVTDAINKMGALKGYGI